MPDNIPLEPRGSREATGDGDVFGSPCRQAEQPQQQPLQQAEQEVEGIPERHSAVHPLGTRSESDKEGVAKTESTELDLSEASDAPIYSITPFQYELFNHINRFVDTQIAENKPLSKAIVGREARRFESTFEHGKIKIRPSTILLDTSTSDDGQVDQSQAGESLHDHGDPLLEPSSDRIGRD